MLVSEQQLSKALELGRLFSLDLSPCFRQLARNALSRAPLFGVGEASGELGEAGLAVLVRTLDSRATAHRYGLAVASGETISILFFLVVLIVVVIKVWLESSTNSRMPAWLFAELQLRHPEALLQLLISHRRLDEALKVALALLEEKGASLPLALLDKLRLSLDEDLLSRSQLEQAFSRAVKQRVK